MEANKGAGARENRGRECQSFGTVWKLNTGFWSSWLTWRWEQHNEGWEGKGAQKYGRRENVVQEAGDSDFSIPHCLVQFWFYWGFTKFNRKALNFECRWFEVPLLREVQISNTFKHVFDPFVSHQMFYSSTTPNSSVSQSECNHVTKSFSSEGLDLFRVLSKAINELLNTWKEQKRKALKRIL